MTDERDAQQLVDKNEMTEKELQETTGGFPPDPCIPVDPCFPVDPCKPASKKR
jgi:bacteriocin-like protein